MPLFTISRRLGHASTRTTEQVYEHLRPEALQSGAALLSVPSRLFCGSGLTSRHGGISVPRGLPARRAAPVMSVGFQAVMKVESNALLLEIPWRSL
ncbi:hypothetical protein [Arthrobacter sp. OV608]|uniref:hypothetical protein n=1 Tax=Arthrobacter sp. OV608 TaxID=1882768 RepID=UPI0025708026|nr:hypothetical protein [Arthrobacter sp. OV608]